VKHVGSVKSSVFRSVVGSILESVKSNRLGVSNRMQSGVYLES